MRGRLEYGSFAALALLGVACGGEDRGRPAGASRGSELPKVDQCAIAARYEADHRSIVSFEPDPALPDDRAVCELAGAMSCSFYFNYDTALSVGSLNESLNPICPRSEPATTNIPTPSNIPTTPLSEERCGASGSAFRLVATNIATCTRPDTGRTGWGGSLDITLPQTTGFCGDGSSCLFENGRLSCADGSLCVERAYDASAFDGISLWVKKGEGPSNSAVIVSVVDQYSGGAGFCDQSDPNAMPGSPPVPDTEKCDGFGVAVTLTDEWTFVPIPFKAMRQKGFGKPSPLGAVDSSHLARIQILLTPGDWDFWIDDLRFFRAPD